MAIDIPEDKARRIQIAGMKVSHIVNEIINETEELPESESRKKILDGAILSTQGNCDITIPIADRWSHPDPEHEGCELEAGFPR